MNYIRRLHEESLNYDIPLYSDCLGHLTYNPPQTMYQVLETACLFLTVMEIGMERVPSLGIIDKILQQQRRGGYAFRRRTIAAGKFLYGTAEMQHLKKTHHKSIKTTFT